MWASSKVEVVLFIVVAAGEGGPESQHSIKIRKPVLEAVIGVVCRPFRFKVVRPLWFKVGNFWDTKWTPDAEPALRNITRPLHAHHYHA